MPESNQDDLHSLRAYYDHNTPRFLSYGGQRNTGTIHRAVWGEGVQNEELALHYVHQLILKELHALQSETTSDLSALDLGCGVGASLFYLAERLDEEFAGIGLTISPVQAKIAGEERRRKNLEKNCMFILGNFLRPPVLKQFDLVFSIEAYAHTNDPEGYFQAAVDALTPGGRLVVCDDFLARDGVEGIQNEQHKKWLKIFQQGWGVSGLWTLDYVERLAGSFNLTLIENINLTSYLQLKPLPNFVIDLLSAGIGIIPGNNLYMKSVIGGQALQMCLANGIVEYRYLVFEKGSGTGQ
jgi:SAM-dependent methyltransferase